MSESWDRLMDRLAAMESRLATLETTANYPAPARRKDEDLAAAIRRGGRFTVSSRIGTITKLAPELGYTTHTFDASYDTGGETISGLSTLAGTIQSAWINPKNGYTFKYLSGKILAYTTAGTEVVAATDLLAAVGTVDVLVTWAGQTDRVVYRAHGDEKLISASFRVGTAVAKDGTNYWTIELRQRDSIKTRGVVIGNRILTNSRPLAADSSIVFTDDDAGYDLTDGDELAFVATAATNVSAKLDDVVVTLEFQRRLV